MTADPIYLDNRLSRATDALWLATLENLPSLLDETARDAARSNISALWAAFDDPDRAVLQRFVRHWNDDRAEHVFNIVRVQPNVEAAIGALTLDDRNRVIAHALWVGHPPSRWSSAEMSGRVDPT
jgi:hypothetical protein